MWFKYIIHFLKDKAYRSLSLSTLFILINGTVFYHFIEHLKWIDALYFSVITLTTVGYGDFSPQTDLGKIFTIFYILTGLGIIFGFIDAFYKHRMNEIKEKKKKKIYNKKKDNSLQYGK